MTFSNEPQTESVESYKQHNKENDPGRTETRTSSRNGSVRFKKDASVRQLPGGENCRRSLPHDARRAMYAAGRVGRESRATTLVRKQGGTV